MTWKKGESGNPGGQSKGARRLLSDAFIRDCARKWKECGEDVLTNLCEKDPGKFASLVCSLIPRDYDMDRDERIHKDMSREELEAKLDLLIAERNGSK